MENIFDDFEASVDEAVSSASKEVVLSEEEQAIEQRTKAWFREKLGKKSDSRLSKIAKLLKNGDFSAEAKAEMMLISIERSLSEEGIEVYIAEQMSKSFRQTRWGNKYEPICRELASIALGFGIKEVGFKANDTIDNFGGSVDGESEYYVFEIKCPYDMIKHEKLLRAGKIDRDNEYYPQIQAHLMHYPDKAGCYFISFDPRRTEDKRLFMYLVERDNEYIAWLETILTKAEEFINAI